LQGLEQDHMRAQMQEVRPAADHARVRIEGWNGRPGSDVTINSQSCSSRFART
jgi:hypothetical protein